MESVGGCVGLGGMDEYVCVCGIRVMWCWELFFYYGEFLLCLGDFDIYVLIVMVVLDFGLFCFLIFSLCVCFCGVYCCCGGVCVWW